MSVATPAFHTLKPAPPIGFKIEAGLFLQLRTTIDRLIAAGPSKRVSFAPPVQKNIPVLKTLFGAIKTKSALDPGSLVGQFLSQSFHHAVDHKGPHASRNYQSH